MEIYGIGDQQSHAPRTPTDAELQAQISETFASLVTALGVASVQPETTGSTAPQGVSLGKKEAVLDESDPFVEQALADRFDRGVGNIAVADIAVTLPGRKLPRSLQKFSLVPVKSQKIYSRSLSPSGYMVDVPEGLRTSYRKEYEGRPYLDTQYGIGLAKDGWLVGLSAAGIDLSSRLKIVQLQDVSGTVDNEQAGATPKERFKTGLHDGLDWRATLVEAWATLAYTEKIGEQIIIQGARNNQWKSIRKELMHPAYDGVAVRNGFTPLMNGDWIRDAGLRF